ncbi:MAG: hypothetical protein JRI68_01295 [Deltaproteobacteria bacterium]|nr:hypothetical protein [Deltaproteobacteria bacterium]
MGGQTPMTLGLLARRALAEHERQEAVFDLPRTCWYDGATALDLSVDLHGRPASTPLGLAASPQGQLAQGIVLGWLAGGRVFRLPAPRRESAPAVARPSIDAASLCFTLGSTHELTATASREEYVKAWMLLAILEAAGVTATAQAARPDTRFEPTLRFNPDWLRGSQGTDYLRGMMDAKPTIDGLRDELHGSLARFRDLDYAPQIATSVTLEVPPDGPTTEVEAMGETLLRDLGVGLTLQLDPGLLGHDRLCAILHDRLGYREVQPVEPTVDQAARRDQLLAAILRLGALAEAEGQSLSVELAQPLPVHNHRHAFPTARQMVLSGPPLFPIHTALALTFREALGAGFPVSFRGGIDEHNVAEAIACGLTPATVGAALLRPEGYGRLATCLQALEQRMTELGVRDLPSFILAAEGARSAGIDDPKAASLHNLRAVAERALADPHYTREQSSPAPRKIGSPLVLFDCISCDKCVACCPHDANFTYEIESINSFSEAAVVTGDGAVALRPSAPFVVERSHQLACWVDFCNGCGNCDVFCPEDGGPQFAKPHFFGSREAFDEEGQQDGLFVAPASDRIEVFARLNRRRYQLELDRRGGTARFSDGVLELDLSVDSGVVERASVAPGAAPEGGHTLSTHPARTLLAILTGVLDLARPNPVNAALLDDEPR